MLRGFNRQGIEKVVPHTLSDESRLIPTLQTASVLPHLRFNPDVFKDFLLRWNVMNQVAFHQAVSPSLRFMFSYLCAVQAPFISNLVTNANFFFNNQNLDC